MIYVHLFHGRTDPDQNLDDWGEDGPVLGPFNYYHTTYRYHVRLGINDNKYQIWEPYLSRDKTEDLIYYDGMYYGDMSVSSAEIFKQDGYEPEEFNPKKAKGVH